MRKLYLACGLLLVFFVQCQRQYITHEEGLFTPGPITGCLQGEVLDAKTHRPIPGALVAFLNPGTEPLQATGKSGKFSLTVTAHTHKIRITASGYEPREVQIKVPREGMRMKCFLKRGKSKETPQRTETAEAEKPKTVKNPKSAKFQKVFSIYFDEGSSHIRPEFYSLLSKVTQILKENPSLEAVIRGHTDSMYDFGQSERETSSVKECLVNSGVDSRRLVTQNCGGRFPKGDNRTVSGRRLNRRVDIVLY